MNGISIILPYDHWCTVIDACEGALAELKAAGKSRKSGFASAQAIKAADDKLSLILEELVTYLGEFRAEEAAEQRDLWTPDPPSGPPAKRGNSRKKTTDEV